MEKIIEKLRDLIYEGRYELAVALAYCNESAIARAYVNSHIPFHVLNFTTSPYSGFGDGDGNGNGFGDGYGGGDGSGYGNGNGDGYEYGNGGGNGTGDGNGYADGNGNGNGDEYGYRIGAVEA